MLYVSAQEEGDSQHLTGFLQDLLLFTPTVSDDGTNHPFLSFLLWQISGSFRLMDMLSVVAAAVKPGC